MNSPLVVIVVSGIDSCLFLFDLGIESFLQMFQFLYTETDSCNAVIHKGNV